MFAFDDVPVKFIGLLVLFAWCTLWCTYELTRPQNGRQRVSNVLHLVMAVVMLLMVARPTWMGLLSIVPIDVLTGVFAVGTLWFGWLAVGASARGDRGGRRHAAGHTLMFAAMTWHVAAMAVMRSHRTQAGMDMHWMMDAARPGGTLWVFALVGVPLMAYLLFTSVVGVRDLLRPAAAVTDACTCGAGCACGPDCSCPPAPARDGEIEHEHGGATAVLTAPTTLAWTCHEERPVGSTRYRLAAASDVA